METMHSKRATCLWLTRLEFAQGQHGQLSEMVPGNVRSKKMDEEENKKQEGCRVGTFTPRRWRQRQVDL